MTVPLAMCPDCGRVVNTYHRVRRFLAHARQHPETRFLVSAIGCRIAGWTAREIGPLFAAAPPNCILPPEFLPYHPAPSLPSRK